MSMNRGKEQAVDDSPGLGKGRARVGTGEGAKRKRKTNVKFNGIPKKNSYLNIEHSGLTYKG